MAARSPVRTGRQRERFQGDAKKSSGSANLLPPGRNREVVHKAGWALVPYSAVR